MGRVVAAELGLDDRDAGIDVDRRRDTTLRRPIGSRAGIASADLDNGFETQQWGRWGRGWGRGWGGGWGRGWGGGWGRGWGGWGRRGWGWGGWGGFGGWGRPWWGFRPFGWGFGFPFFGFPGFFW
jgi:hypothetical protein